MNKINLGTGSIFRKFDSIIDNATVRNTFGCVFALLKVSENVFFIFQTDATSLATSFIHSCKGVLFFLIFFFNGLNLLFSMLK